MNLDPQANQAPRQPSVLERLMGVIDDRKRQRPEKSYTTRLFDGGVSAIGAKICEEAAEVVEAAGETGSGAHEHLIREAADVIYHLFVLLSFRDATLAEVESELAHRFGVSGLDEKASRRPAE